MKRIQILGPGCPRCDNLHKNAEAAVAKSGVQAVVEKITDIKEILRFPVLKMPALVIDGEVRIAGRVLPPDEIVKLLGD